MLPIFQKEFVPGLQGFNTGIELGDLVFLSEQIGFPAEVVRARAYSGLSKPIQGRLSYRCGCRSKTSNGIGGNDKPTETGIGDVGSAAVSERQ